MNKPYPVNGRKGCVLFDMNNNPFIRFYNEDKSFIDCELVHNDLSIIIDDTDAFVYIKDDGDGYEAILDHSPATLGIKDEN